MINSNSHSAAVAWVAAALWLSSCSAGGGAPGQPRGASSFKQSAVATAPSPLPLDFYRRSISERLLLGQAQDIIINRCLARFGFAALDFPSDEAAAQASEAEAQSRIYGISDSNSATKYGFGVSPQFLVQPTQKPTSATLDFVMNGFKPADGPPITVPTTSPGSVKGQKIPAGGCVGEAFQRIQGSASIDDAFPLAGDLAIQAGLAAQADPRVLGYFSQWSQCMQAKGYRYINPLKAGAEFVRDPKEKASQKEIQAALTDIECKKSTNLISRWQAVDIEYEKEAIEKNQLALTEERNRLDNSLAIAAKIAANQVN